MPAAKEESAQYLPEKKKMRPAIKPSALDIFFDIAIAMANPPMTNPAKSLLSCMAIAGKSRIKQKSRIKTGVAACALSSSSFQSNDLPSEQAPLLYGDGYALSSRKIKGMMRSGESRGGPLGKTESKRTHQAFNLSEFCWLMGDQRMLVPLSRQWRPSQTWPSPRRKRSCPPRGQAP